MVAICPANWFGGVYKEDKPEYFFAQFYVDPKAIFDVQSEYPDSARGEGGVSAGANRGDRRQEACDEIRLEDRRRHRIDRHFYDVNPQLTLRGIYTAPTESARAPSSFIAHMSKRRLGNPAKSAHSESSWTRPTARRAVMETVDAMFKNSAAPTKTETEASFQASFVAMLGNVKGLIAGIGLVVVFTISLIAANSMAMSGARTFHRGSGDEGSGFPPRIGSGR